MAISEAGQPVINSEEVGYDEIKVKTKSGTNLSSNITQVNGTAISTTNPIPAKLSDGTNDYDARDRNWSLSETTDKVKADIDTISGSVPSATNPLPSRLTDGTNYISSSNPLPVSVIDAVPGTPKKLAGRVQDLAKNTGSAVALDSGSDYVPASGTKVKISEIILSSAGQCYVVLQVSSDGTTWPTDPTDPTDSGNLHAIILNSPSIPTVSLPVDIEIIGDGTKTIRAYVYNFDSANDVFVNVKASEI